LGAKGDTELVFEGGEEFVITDRASYGLAGFGVDDDELVRDVATALGAYGSEAASALSTLKALADAETDDEMRWYFREAIRKITGEE